MSKQAPYEIAIIGGGLAGGLSALINARAGKSVLLLEREVYPHHKVCGEFLSAEGVASLSRAGFDFDRLGATRIQSLRLNGPRFSFACRLPWEARGLSRQVMDRELLTLARQAGCQVEEGSRVTNVRTPLSAENPIFSVYTEKSSSNQTELYEAQRIVVATGKHDLRGVAERKASSALVGYKMHLRLDPESLEKLSGWIELFIFEGGYAGLSLVENQTANLCFVLDKRLAKKVSLKWDLISSELSALSPALGAYLQQSQSLWPRPLTIAPIPYGFVRAPRQRSQLGMTYLGDQLAVIPSLTGDGMSIALASAELESSGAALNQHNLRRQIQSAVWLQRLFAHPRLLDFSLALLNALPLKTSQTIVKKLFLRTRFAS